MEDFRRDAFSRMRIDECGRYLGHRTYWKLYSIENYLRVILHSVLSAQVDPAWFDVVVAPHTKRNILRMKEDHSKRNIHTPPGSHDIYYLYLSDLTKIWAEMRHLIGIMVKDADSWILRLEGVRIPRNLVGHMNFPNAADRGRIDTLYADLAKLIQRLERTRGLVIKIP